MLDYHDGLQEMRKGKKEGFFAAAGYLLLRLTDRLPLRIPIPNFDSKPKPPTSAY